MQFLGKKINIEIKPVVLFGLILLMAGAIFFVLKDNFFKRFISFGNETLTTPASSMNDNLDQDNDGLPDKFEQVLGTDLSKNDTDSDGYYDFEEVKNGYSPVIAGSMGKLSFEEFASLKNKIKDFNPDLYEKIYAVQEPLAVALSNTVLRDQPSTAPSAAPVILSGPAVFKEEVSLSNKNWKYSFYIPADLEKNKPYPLMIGLHGFGGKAVDFIKYWQSDADNNKFYVAVLQAYPKTYPGGTTIESYPWLEISDFTRAVLSNVQKKYQVNEDNIFLTGYSAGASTSYIVALESGIKFKGIIPIDGYLPLDAGIINILSKARDMNFYVVHGENDLEREAVEKQEKILLQYGAKMEFKIIPNTAHEYPQSEHADIISWVNGLK